MENVPYQIQGATGPHGKSDASRMHAMVPQVEEDLIAGRTDRAARLFHANDSAAPIVAWSPSILDLRRSALRSVLTACDAQTMPLAILDHENFAAVADWAMVLEPVADDHTGSDFVYTRYGAQITAAYQADMTGRRVSEIGGHVSVLLRALYGAAMKRRAIVSCVHEPPQQTFIRTWSRLVVPLYDPTNAITRLVVVTVPENELRAGLELLSEAIMIVAADGTVHYANRAACHLFDRPRTPIRREHVSAFSNINVDLPSSPDEPIIARTPKIQRAVVMRGQQMAQVELAIGGTYYKDMPFYVLRARMTRQ